MTRIPEQAIEKCPYDTPSGICTRDRQNQRCLCRPAPSEAARALGDLKRDVYAILAAKDDEVDKLRAKIAALREALIEARESLVWFDNQYCHGVRQPTYLYANINAALETSGGVK